MCSARRIRVRASSRLARMWQEELTRTGEASALVTGEATLREEFGGLLGKAARNAFETALGSDTRWEWRDSAYRMETDGGRIAYFPESGELEMTLRLTDVVTARGAAVRTVRGTVDVETTAESSARYFEDGWADLTRESARREAECKAQAEADRDARRQLGRRLEEERRSGRRRLAAEAEQLAAEAARDAERRLAGPCRRRHQELSREAARRLADGRTGFLRPVHEVLAAAYRDTVVGYARANGAEGLTVAEDDGVISVRFEMEV
ncbi:hypothetical protein [Streptomyces aidingensis]|uniref:FtsH ternary system domain-containing protein n=1 Tax=Streptomyces aidingensis TaxID=910347 RepID=A0A1I1NRW2_9ACTN|nr:hypothetical protein [Streptomyces aidingensis]SFC97513.1 hypothetical protein SAMN05421773_10822 [Streptomyces aidingensis]